MSVQASMKTATNKCAKWPTQIAVCKNARVRASRQAVHVNEAEAINTIQPELRHTMTVEIAGLLRCRKSNLLENGKGTRSTKR